jgi:hypothetical protein
MAWGIILRTEPTTVIIMLIRRFHPPTNVDAILALVVHSLSPVTTQVPFVGVSMKERGDSDAKREAKVYVQV